MRRQTAHFLPRFLHTTVGILWEATELWSKIASMVNGVGLRQWPRWNDDFRLLSTAYRSKERKGHLSLTGGRDSDIHCRSMAEILQSIAKVRGPIFESSCKAHLSGICAVLPQEYLVDQRPRHQHQHTSTISFLIWCQYAW